MTIYPLPGPNGTLVYMCPSCGGQFESMTAALLCELTHEKEVGE